MLPTPPPSDLLGPIFRDARDVLMLTWAGVRAPSGAALDTAAALSREINKTKKGLTELLTATPLAPVPAHVERIADAIDGLIRACHLMESEGTTFTTRAMREVNGLFERAVELLECAADTTLTADRVLARHVEVESLRFQDLATEYAHGHEKRVVEGICRPSSSSAYLAILDYLSEVTRLSRVIAGRIAPGTAPDEGPFFSI